MLNTSISFSKSTFPFEFSTAGKFNMSSKGTIYNIANYLRNQRRVEFWFLINLTHTTTKSCPLFRLHEVHRHNVEQNISQMYLDSDYKRAYCYFVFTSSKNWKFLSFDFTSNSVIYPRQVWTGLYSLVII